MPDANTTILQLQQQIHELESRLAERNERERAFQSMVENSLDIIYRTDLTGTITYVSPAIEQASGYCADEIIGSNMRRSFFVPTEKRRKLLAELRQNGFVQTFITDLKRKDGTTWWASSNGHYYRNKNGDLAGVEGIIRDITRSMETDYELRQLFEMSLDMICIADLHTGRFLKVNPAFTTTLGYREEELVGTPFYQFLHPDDMQRTGEAVEDLLKGQKILEFRNRYRCKDGSYRWLRWVSHPNSTTGLTYAIAHDITEAYKREEQLKQSEQKFRSIIESAPMGILLYELREDDRLVVTGANDTVKGILGFDTDSLIGLTMEEAFPRLANTELPDAYRAVCKTGRVWQSEQVIFQAENVSGTYEVYAFQTVPGKLAIFFLDITERKAGEMERKQLQDQLVQSRKMDAIGQLAGGVAHDFNNMLGGIIGAAEMLDKLLPDEPMARRFNSMILEAAGRAADLTSKLLAFSRNSPPASSPVDVHDIIRETVTLLQNTIDRRITLHTDLQAAAFTVVGDPSQLQNVLLNLGINGSHAMPEGGTLSIATRVADVDPETGDDTPFSLKPGRHLEIEVRDTGMGIEPEHLGRVFEPFFTTKGQGRGTGLGLASAYGTIKQHGGSISVHSEPDTGTVFRILLPLAHVQAIQKSPLPPVQHGCGRVLVVDDEEVMRLTARAILEDLGYQVILAENGRDAIDSYTGLQGEIDLIILDMVMPVMNGRDCFAALRKIDRNVKVILSSGFTREEDLQEMKMAGLDAFVRKPYRANTLSQVVHDVLAS